MREKLEQIKEMALKELNEAENKAILENIKVKYLGKKGELTQILRGMGALSKEERPIIGKIANEIRETLEKHIEEASNNIKLKEKEFKLKKKL